MGKIYREYIEKEKFFNKKAASWHIPEYDRECVEKIIQDMKLSSQIVILDVGCGTGELFPIIRYINPQVRIIGIDLSIKMLEKSEKNAAASTAVIQGVAEQLPFTGDSIDIILNYCIFPHIIFKSRAIREFYRVLKLGGKYFIIHPGGRVKVNSIHRNIGEVVQFDVLPEVKVLKEKLISKNFNVLNSVDQEGLFFLEANK